MLLSLPGKFTKESLGYKFYGMCLVSKFSSRSMRNNHHKTRICIYVYNVYMWTFVRLLWEGNIIVYSYTHNYIHKFLSYKNFIKQLNRETGSKRLSNLLTLIDGRASIQIRITPKAMFLVITLLHKRFYILYFLICCSSQFIHRGIPDMMIGQEWWRHRLSKAMQRLHVSAKLTKSIRKAQIKTTVKYDFTLRLRWLKKKENRK